MTDVNSILSIFVSIILFQSNSILEQNQYHSSSYCIITRRHSWHVDECSDLYHCFVMFYFPDYLVYSMLVTMDLGCHVHQSWLTTNIRLKFLDIAELPMLSITSAVLTLNRVRPGVRRFRTFPAFRNSLYLYQCDTGGNIKQLTTNNRYKNKYID